MISLIADILFPANCLICGRLGNYLCPLCFKRLKIINKDICPVCTGGSYMGFVHNKCQRETSPDGLKSFYYYDRNFKKLLSRVKYRLASRGMPELLEWICAKNNQQIYEFLNYCGKIDYLIPVPLSKARQRSRGFNQSDIIARYLSKALKIPVCDQYVLKIRDTIVQAKLKNTKERRKNVRGAFSINDKIGLNLRAAKILLIDDVWTSGSTASEICRVLKSQGMVEKVYVFTLSRSHY